MTNKPSRNINEQIELLKSRGMLFRNETTAKTVLKNISYYRLKGYWWDEVSSWMESISYLRNIVAHHSRVWSRTMVKTPMTITHPNHLWLQMSLTKYQAKRPFYVISAMLYLCNAVQNDNLFKIKLLDLFSKYPNIPLHKLGFNNQWEKQHIWG